MAINTDEITKKLAQLDEEEFERSTMRVKKEKIEKEKETAKTKAKTKKKSAAKAAIIGAAGVATLAGIGTVDFKGIADRFSRDNETGIETTVDDNKTYEEGSLEAIVDELIKDYEAKQDEIADIIENVDDQGYHFTEEGVSWKYGVLNFDETMANVDDYYQTKIDTLEDVMKDGVVTDEEKAIVDGIKAEAEEEVRIKAVVDNKENLYTVVADAMNHGEGTNIKESQVKKIFEGKEGQTPDVYLLFEDEKDLASTIDGINNKKSLEGTKLDAVVVEFDESAIYDDLKTFMDDAKHTLTTQGITLEGTKTKEVIRENTPAPTPQPLPDPKPQPQPLPEPEIKGAEEVFEQEEKVVPNSQTHKKEKPEAENINESSEKAVEETFSATEENFGDVVKKKEQSETVRDNRAHEETFGDNDVTSSQGIQVRIIATEESFGDIEDEPVTVTEVREAVSEIYGDLTDYDTYFFEEDEVESSSDSSSAQVATEEEFGD